MCILWRRSVVVFHLLVHMAAIFFFEVSYHPSHGFVFLRNRSHREGYFSLIKFLHWSKICETSGDWEAAIFIKEKKKACKTALLHCVTGSPYIPVHTQYLASAQNPASGYCLLCTPLSQRGNPGLFPFFGFSICITTILSPPCRDHPKVLSKYGSVKPLVPGIAVIIQMLKYIPITAL